MVQAHFGGKALCASINADECVAHGAAVLAAQRIDGSKAIKLKDVAPLSIGIGVKGGIIKVKANARKRCAALFCRPPPTHAHVVVLFAMRDPLLDR